MALPKPKSANIIARPMCKEEIRPKFDVSPEKLSPSIRNSLHLYLRKLPTDTAERDRCIQLIRQLDAGVTNPPQTRINKTRPQSAMDYRAMEKARQERAYKTSYQNDYPQKEFETTNAYKQHSHGITFPRHYTSDVLDHTTNYATQFQGHAHKRQMPYIGDGSGNTDDHRNNPHPKESFVWWRYPTRPCYDDLELKADDVTTSRPHAMTIQDYDRACRGKIRSTYQVDYLALKQGQWDPNLKIVDKQRRHTGRTLNRYAPPPQLPDQLKVSTKRYGSNFLKQVPAVGMGPEGTTIYRDIKNSTCYADDYNDMLPHHASNMYTY